MSELIDRERFSADMRDFQNRVGIWRDEAEDTETRTRADAALATIIETKLILDKQPTIAAPRWHRVEEELPDKYTQCLVADADGKCAVGYYRYDCEAWDSPAFGWIESEDRIYIDYMPMGIGKVVAWMPIEPPKEEDA